MVIVNPKCNRHTMNGQENPQAEDALHPDLHAMLLSS